MKKRRTKKDKKSASHSFLIKWDPGSSKYKSELGVNRQFKNKADSNTKISHTHESANLLAKENEIAVAKKGILRSILLSSLILSLEIVLYLFWLK